MYRRFLSAFATLMPALLMAQPCPPGYVPRPEQDCQNAIVLCNARYQSPNYNLCGRGLILDSLRGSCGTTEHVSSYYQFTVRASGVLNFLILPNDVTDTISLGSEGGSLTDYDFALYQVPAGSSVSQATCRLFRGGFNTPSPFQVSCDYSSLKGATGMWDPYTSPPAKFQRPITVQAGETYLLHVDNFSTTTVGYQIIFRTPRNDARYADVTTPAGLAINSIGFDPNCTGMCPAVLHLNRPIQTQGLHVQVYDPLDLSRRFNAFVASNRPVSDTLWIFGDFSPLDSNLSIVVRSDSAPIQYRCGQGFLPVDTIPLRVANRRRPNAYYIITQSRTALERQFIVSPNPFAANLTISLPEGASYTVRLVDATGKQVFRTNPLPGGVVHALSLPAQLPSGFYFVEAVGQDHTFRKRLLRQ